MADGKLAILMPTYRFDETARHCIQTVARMASPPIEVYISDNSCNPAKCDFLHKLAEHSPHLHIYCHETNIGANGSWLFLLEQQTHEFTCMASDDDMFSPDYFLAGLEELKSNPTSAAASGLIMLFSGVGQQARVVIPTSNLKPTAVERLVDYHGPSTIPYMVHRRADALSYHRYLMDRPFFPSYLDQFFTYTLLSQGAQVIRQDRKMFLYDNRNWSDTETCMASDAGCYVTAGLPDAFKHLHHMSWAVDIVHYFNSRYRPKRITDAQADRITSVLFNRQYIDYFLPRIGDNIQELMLAANNAPSLIDNLKAIIATPYNRPERLLSLYVEIVREFNADLAHLYASFVKNSLRPIVTPVLTLAGQEQPSRELISHPGSEL